MLLSKPHFLSCNFPSSPSSSSNRNPRFLSQFLPNPPTRRTSSAHVPKILSSRTFLGIYQSIYFTGTRAQNFPACKDSIKSRDSEVSVEEETRRSGDGGRRGNDWTTSILLLGLWGGLMFYVFRLTPDQTPGPSRRLSRVRVHPRRPWHRAASRRGLGGDIVRLSGVERRRRRTGRREIESLVITCALMKPCFKPLLARNRDAYFVQKLLYLKGDDGYQMNAVLLALWNIMALWPVIYSMLLLPAGRSSRSKVPVWPFLLLSFLGGAYALIPYFVLWKPPPPAIGEDEIRKWPLNFLESKITAWLVVAAGLGLVAYALLANEDMWKEFYQYFRESKFIHIMSLDFLLLSSFAPFWVYNDMTARRWVDKGVWLLPFSLIPLLGPALYIALRPQLVDLPTRVQPDSIQNE